MAKPIVYAARTETEVHTVTEAQRAAAKARRPFNRSKEKAAKKSK